MNKAEFEEWKRDDDAKIAAAPPLDIAEFARDPRHHATKILLDGIAAIWQDEYQLDILELSFRDQYNTNFMSWVSGPQRERRDYVEFKRLYQEDPS